MFKKKKFLNITVLVLGLGVAIISATYAYFTASASDNSISGGTASFDLDMQIVRTSSEGILFPLEDSYIESAIAENCLVDEEMVVCQIYKITLSNQGNTGVILEGIITLEPTEGSSINNLKWQRLSDSGTYDNNAVINGMNSANLADDYYASPNSTKDFYIVLWDSDTDVETIDMGSYTGEVKFTTEGEEVIVGKFGS